MILPKYGVSKKERKAEVSIDKDRLLEAALEEQEEQFEEEAEIPNPEKSESPSKECKSHSGLIVFNTFLLVILILLELFSWISSMNS